MNRPYIISHMMTSLDGRIDCGMTAKLPGVEEYYAALNKLNLTATLSGRVTAQLEMAKKGEFEAKNKEPLNAEKFSKKISAKEYSIAVDTKGSLLWQGTARCLLSLLPAKRLQKNTLLIWMKEIFHGLPAAKRELTSPKPWKFLQKNLA